MIDAHSIGRCRQDGYPVSRATGLAQCGKSHGGPNAFGARFWQRYDRMQCCNTCSEEQESGRDWFPLEGAEVVATGKMGAETQLGMHVLEEGNGIAWYAKAPYRNPCV